MEAVQRDLEGDEDLDGGSREFVAIQAIGLRSLSAPVHSVHPCFLLYVVCAYPCNPGQVGPR